MIIASFPKGSFPENSWPVGTWPVAPEGADIQYTEVMEFAVCIATSAEFDVIMPNAGFAEGEGLALMEVSGAGTSEVNGTYAENGTKFEKPRYRMVSAQSATGYFYVVWAGPFNRWCISVQGDDSVSYTQIMTGARYSSGDDVATPDLVTTWANGDLPVPTVTKIATPTPTLTQIVDMYLPMPMIIDFELYEELSK